MVSNSQFSQFDPHSINDCMLWLKNEEKAVKAEASTNEEHQFLVTVFQELRRELEGTANSTGTLSDTQITKLETDVKNIKKQWKLNYQKMETQHEIKIDANNLERPNISENTLAPLNIPILTEISKEKTSLEKEQIEKRILQLQTKDMHITWAIRLGVLALGATLSTGIGIVAVMFPFLLGPVIGLLVVLWIPLIPFCFLIKVPPSSKIKTLEIERNLVNNLNISQKHGKNLRKVINLFDEIRQNPKVTKADNRLIQKLGDFNIFDSKYLTTLKNLPDNHPAKKNLINNIKKFPFHKNHLPHNREELCHAFNNLLKL